MRNAEIGEPADTHLSPAAAAWSHSGSASPAALRRSSLACTAATAAPTPSQNTPRPCSSCSEGQRARQRCAFFGGAANVPVAIERKKKKQYSHTEPSTAAGRLPPQRWRQGPPPPPPLGPGPAPRTRPAAPPRPRRPQPPAQPGGPRRRPGAPGPLWRPPRRIQKEPPGESKEVGVREIGYRYKGMQVGAALEEGMTVKTRGPVAPFIVHSHPLHSSSTPRPQPSSAPSWHV